MYFPLFNEISIVSIVQVIALPLMIEFLINFLIYLILCMCARQEAIIKRGMLMETITKADLFLRLARVCKYIILHVT